MKRKMLAWVCALLLALSAVGAMAGVSASPKQDLALRTGPNTRYVWLDMMPQSTRIIAYEYEEGNDVTWVLVEYESDGKLYRGYTGLKRMTVNGNIPWADHLWQSASLTEDCSVYAAPSERGAWRAKLSEDDAVTLLGYENGYAYIEFYDQANGADSRGYIYDWELDDGLYGESGMLGGFGGEYDDDDGGQNGESGMLGGGVGFWLDDGAGHDAIEGVPATPNQRLALRGCPDRHSVWLGHMPQSTQITALEYEKGNGVTWVLIEYWKDGKLCRGYTGLKRMTVHGDIPWADHLGTRVRANWSGTIYAAPDWAAAERDWLNAGESVTLLEYDGEFAFVEFYDDSEQFNSRGYVPADMID